MSTDFRTKGKKCIGEFVKSEKNVTIIEKNIFERWTQEESYFVALYECLFLLKNGEPTSRVLEQIKSGNMGWCHPEFSDVALLQKEQDDFTVSPFQVEEGVLKCPKCGCCKSFSYSKQTRSADEPMTTFATCVACKNKWTYAG